MAFNAMDNQEVVEILVKSRLDIKQFESNLATLERKMSSTQKEMQDSMLKVGQAANKSSMAMNNAANAKLASDRQIIKISQEKLASYRAESAQMEKQIALTKELSKEQIKASYHANAMGSTKSISQPFKMGSESTSSMNAAYAAMESGSKTSSTPSFLQRLLGQHDELDKKMKQVDDTAKNSFPHKVSTTAQYMAAGAGIMLVTSSLTSMITAIVESDKAIGMFQAVLFSDSSTKKAAEQAKELQNSIFTIGKTYGGTVQDLNESALALGRAGIAGKDLATSIQSVSQVALLSGDSLDNITQLLVSWKTVYPDEKMNDLADSMVGVANATLLSMDDLKTVTTYMLTAGQQAGLTSDSLLALAGSWRQLGKAPSTVGTESRRFFEQITSGADDVKKAYKALGINVDAMKRTLADGGPKAEAAMVQMFKVFSTVSQEEGQKAISGLGGILDKATIQALLAMSKTGKDRLTIYQRTLIEAGAKAEGASKEGADKIALTYEKMWERIKNSLTASSSTFGEALKSGFAGTDATAGSFNNKMISLDRILTNLAKTAGTTFGTILQYTDEIIVAYSTYKALVVGSTVLQALGLITTGLNAAKTAQYAFNLAAMRNPYVIAGTALVAGVTYFYSMLEDAQDKFDASQAKTIKAHEAATAAAGTTNGKILSLDSSYKALNKAIEHNKALLSSATGATKTGYENSIKSLEEQVKRNRLARNELAKVGIKSTVPDITSGNPKLEGKDTTKSALRDQQQLLNGYSEIIKANEQEYLLQYGVNTELDKKMHHLKVTLPALKEIAKLTVDEEVRKENIAKIDKEAFTTKLQIRDLEVARAEAGITALRVIENEYDLSKKISDNKRLEITSTQKIIDYQLQLADNITNKKLTEKDALALYYKQLDVLELVTTEQERQLAITQRKQEETIKLTSLQIQASNATSGSEQIALEQEAIRLGYYNKRSSIQDTLIAGDTKGNELKNQEIENARLLMELELRKVEGAQSYHDIMLASTIQFERQNSLAQSFARISESGLSALKTGLTSYFTIGDEGYGKWSVLRDNLLDAILKGLLEELVINQTILQVRQAMAAVSGGSSGGSSFFGELLNVGVSAATSYFTGGTSSIYGLSDSYDYSSVATNNPMGSGGAWAKGGVSFDGNPTYLAKGGYVNSIVSKPTYVAKGTIAGESGAEGVLPLQRDSQGRLGVNSSGSSAPQSITVNIVNESGEKLNITKSESKTDMSGMVLDIVIDAITRNKRGMRDIVKG